VKILFDENVPAPLRHALGPHEVFTVQQLGWAGISNGELVSRAEGSFDILIIADKNLQYQQNLTGRRIALLELPTNRWPQLQGMTPRILAAIEQAKPGSYTLV
jgi:hypothetical protein